MTVKADPQQDVSCGATRPGAPAPGQRIVMVRMLSENDACVRLQSDAIVRGLADTPAFECGTYKPGAAGFGDRKIDCIGFHYNDIEAVRFLRSHRHLAPNALIACFGADIYSYESYTQLHELADLYVVPTELHRSVLAAQLEAPVYALPEPVDPLAIAPDFDWNFPLKRTRRLGWFGYPESFYKGMLSLMPVIQRHLEAGTVDDFALLTDQKRFPNDWNLKLKPFSRETFITDLRAFDYVVVSHFPLDLHVNSLIKSANKAVTALVAGTIPIATDTPSYRELFASLGLERFLVTSPRDLDRVLGGLDPDSDSALIRRSGALDAIKHRLSDTNTARAFVDILAACRDSAAQGSHRAVGARKTSVSYAQFSTERVKLAPRLARAIGNRLPGLAAKRAAE